MSTIVSTLSFKRVCHLVFMVTMFSLTGLTAMLGVDAEHTLSFTTYVSPFSTSPDIETRQLLFQYEEVSAVRCIASCYRFSGSETAAAVISEQTCSCLDSPGTETVANKHQYSTNSIVFTWSEPETADPASSVCKEKAELVDGVCQCPHSFTGQYCELANSESCRENYETIFDSQEQTQDVGSLVDTVEYTQFVKVIFETPGSLYICKVSIQDIQSVNGEFVWTAQIMPTFFQSIDVNLQAFVVKSSLEVFKVEFDERGVDVVVTNETAYIVIAKAVPVTSVTLGYTQKDPALNSLIHLILSGAEVLTGTAAVLGPTADAGWSDCILHVVGQKMYNGSDIYPNEPLSFKNFLYSTDGKMGVYSTTFPSSSRYQVSTSDSAPRDWILDPCWYRATSDPPSDEHLRAAVLQGRRARVLADGFSAVTRAVYLLDNYVLFQSAPYSFPRGDIVTHPIGIAYQLTSTDGSKLECVHKQIESRKLDLVKPGLVSQLDWFVESRDITELYRTDLSGGYISGTLDDLAFQAAQGADLQLVLNILDVPSEDPVTMSVSVDRVTLSSTASEEVVVEVRDILYITTASKHFGIQEVNYVSVCAVLNLYISSKNGLSGMVYTVGKQGSHVVWDFGVPTDGGQILWFARAV